jgi:hypothetical protein
VAQLTDEGRSERSNNLFIIEESTSVGQFLSRNVLFDGASAILTVNRNTVMVRPLRQSQVSREPEDFVLWLVPFVATDLGNKDKGGPIRWSESSGGVSRISQSLRKRSQFSPSSEFPMN